jgi:hypothetical protein
VVRITAEQDTTNISPFWFTSGLYVPVINVIAGQIMPVSIDSAYNAQKYATLKDSADTIKYTKEVRKERYKQTMTSTIIGITLMIWWGLLIL